MARFILAAAAVLGLGIGGAFAQSLSHSNPPTHYYGDGTAHSS